MQGLELRQEGIIMLSPSAFAKAVEANGIWQCLALKRAGRAIAGENSCPFPCPSQRASWPKDARDIRPRGCFVLLKLMLFYALWGSAEKHWTGALFVACPLPARSCLAASTNLSRRQKTPLAEDGTELLHRAGGWGWEEQTDQLHATDICLPGFLPCPVQQSSGQPPTRESRDGRDKGTCCNWGPTWALQSAYPHFFLATFSSNNILTLYSQRTPAKNCIACWVISLLYTAQTASTKAAGFDQTSFPTCYAPSVTRIIASSTSLSLLLQHTRSLATMPKPLILWGRG